MSVVRITAFEDDLARGFQELRASIRDMMEAAGLSPADSGAVARSARINRNLTWKVMKVLTEPDLYSAMQHLPGSEGMTILATAMRNAGAGEELVSNFERALERFESTIGMHAGDRSTLELILDSMAGAGTPDRMEQSRKLAFRGNSGVWGVQARVRSTTAFVAPCASDPNLVDMAMVGGVVDFRRLRPGIRWPILRPRLYRDDGTPIALGPNEQAIDPHFANSAGPKLIGDFCTNHMPPIEAVKGKRGWVYELGEGPVGNTGAFTCFFGVIQRSGAPRYRSESDRFADLFSQVTMPAEFMQFDLIVHRELEFMMSPRVLMIGHSDMHEPGLSHQSIPFDDRPMELVGRPPVMSSSLIPRYGELVSRVFERAAWDARDFRALRLVVKYPPMHSSVVMRCELPER